LTVSCLEQSGSLIAQADRAMARGDIHEAASLLEVAAQRGRDSTTLLRLATVRRSLGDLSGALRLNRTGNCGKAVQVLHLGARTQYAASGFPH
jgi:hypothetical protein